MKTIFLPLLLVALFTSINQSSHAADDDSRLWVATSNGKTVKWIGRFDSAHEERVTFWKTGNCDNAGNFSAGLQPVRVSCDFLSLRTEDQRFIQAILENRRVSAEHQMKPTAPAQNKPLTDADFAKPAQSKPQEPFDADKYLAQKESLPAGLTPINANPAQLPEGYIMDFDNPPSTQLTTAQIKARDFMADIESQRKALMKKAGALHILPQFYRWPKGYTPAEESEYLTGNMGMIDAFQYERKCKKYIREIEALIDSAFKNIQPLPD
jgi:hypothetical protein